MTDVITLRMNSQSQSEPVWISNLRVQLSGLHLEYRQADRVMCIILAPKLAAKTRNFIAPATKETNQFWQNVWASDSVDLQKAAEMERLAKPIERQAKLMF